MFPQNILPRAHQTNAPDQSQCAECWQAIRALSPSVAAGELEGREYISRDGHHSGEGEQREFDTGEGCLQYDQVHI